MPLFRGEYPRQEMSEAQEAYIRSLLEQRVIEPDAVTATLRLIEPPFTIDKQRASRWIEELKSRPMRMGQNDTKASLVEYKILDDDPLIKAPAWVGGVNPVPRGSYAVPTTSDGAVNETAFYKLWIAEFNASNRGAWVLYQQISDRFDRMPRYIANNVLKQIADRPQHYAALYGHAIGKCGICGRTLTNDESRSRGIGPICAQKWGW